MLEFNFQKDSPLLCPMKGNGDRHLAINPGRNLEARIRNLPREPRDAQHASTAAQPRQSWLPVRSRSPERWRATRLPSWHPSSWCPHRYPTLSSSTQRCVFSPRSVRTLGFFFLSAARGGCTQLHRNLSKLLWVWVSVPTAVQIQTENCL